MSSIFPFAEKEAHVLLFEPKTTLNTGNVESERTVRELEKALMTVINLKTDIPGPKSLALVARREASTPRGAAKLTPLAFTHAQGAAITDIDGNTLLDFAGGIGMLAVGHNHPQVVAAIKAQADDLIHPCAIVGSYEPYVALAEKLTEIVPISGVKKAILLNSGAESRGNRRKNR